ncbi:hypothetical protein ACLKMH_06280 [Psychromonas sp. KJ10-10]|uniref:hypothetical protein n=1 Tax=Psychromonas sp. KJ10-10 TaxID=3391823 RepID=UPI0039B4DB08
MSLFLPRSLAMLACLGLLTACIETDSDDTSTSTYVVFSMSSVESDYQTFQQRDLDYDGNETDSDESEYIYKDRDSDDSTSVVFNSANDSDTQTEDLEVVAITDINDIYTALSIDDVTIKVDGTNYSGDYILIQEKSGGDLYPVVMSNLVPLANTELSDDIFWHSSHRYSNIADEDRIYLNDSDDEILYVFELEDDLFTYIDAFDYQDNDFWVNASGDILTQETSDTSEMSLLDRSTSETIVESFSTSKLLPFVYEGDFYVARTSSTNIYELEADTSDFSWSIDDTWADNDDSYKPTTNSARRGDFEMNASCELYEFDDSNPFSIEINLIDDFSASNGQLAVAGQDALFCVDADSSDSSALPIIIKFDTETEPGC